MKIDFWFLQIGLDGRERGPGHGRNDRRKVIKVPIGQLEFEVVVLARVMRPSLNLQLRVSEIAFGKFQPGLDQRIDGRGQGLSLGACTGGLATIETKGLPTIASASRLMGAFTATGTIRTIDR